VDGDGDLDLYCSSYFDRPNKLYRNDTPPGNHWLEIALEGTVSPRTPIGARVTVESGGHAQHRELLANCGYRSQGPLSVHFGLGASNTADLVRVRWPSGAVTETTLVAADQRVTIGEASVVAVGDRPVVATPPVAGPNPTAGVARIAFTLAAPGTRGVQIVDAQGRRVRTLAPAARLEAGRHVRTWDGRDDVGRPVPEGLYLVVLSSPDGPAVTRIVVRR